MIQADSAALEVDQKLALVKALPSELQQLVYARAGLRDNAADELLRSSAQRLAQHTLEIVKEARLAWIEAALKEGQKANVTTIPEEELFRRINVTVLDQDDQLKWSALDEDDVEAVRQARHALLLKIWTKEQVLVKYSQALQFAEKYKCCEPKKEAVRGFLEIFSKDTLELFALPAADRFERQKVAKWTTYCSAAYTLAWLTYTAHCRPREDEHCMLSREDD